MSSVYIPNTYVSTRPNAPIANPIKGVNNPVVIDAKDHRDVRGPVLLYPIESLFIGSPEVIESTDPANINAPTLKAALIPASIPSPSVITAKPETDAIPPFSLNHARILYDNKLFGSSVTVSGGTTGSYAILPNTHQAWNFTADGDDSILITLPANADVDTICICSHNLAGLDIEPFWDADATAGGLTSFADEITPTTNNAIMFHVDTAVSARRIQINLKNDTGVRRIGYIMAGVALQMQRPFFGGHTPITDATMTKFYDSNSETSNFIGRSVRSAGQETSVSWKNIDDTWYRNYFEPFKQSAVSLPFGFAWNLLEYPEDVGFCSTSDNISASYSGNRKLRSIDFNLRGHL